MIKIMNLIGIKSRRASEKKVNIDTKNKVLNLYAKLLDNENKSILKEKMRKCIALKIFRHCRKSYTYRSRRCS